MSYDSILATFESWDWDDDEVGFGVGTVYCAMCSVGVSRSVDCSRDVLIWTSTIVKRAFLVVQFFVIYNSHLFCKPL